MEPVADALGQKYGWLVYSPTLPGHEKEGELKSVTYKEWVLKVEAATEELLKRCERVYVIGFSMGGMLASYVAARYPVEKLVLLNAAAFYLNPSRLLQEMVDSIRFHITGEEEDGQMTMLYDQKFRETPFAAVLQFMQVVRKTRPYIRNVHVPTLIIQGELDGLVPLRSAHYLYDIIRTSKKEVKVMKRSRHMICHGCEKEELIQEIEVFLTANTAREEESS